MNKLIATLLIGLFVFNSNYLVAQQSAKVQMTPAEYQSLLETILKAKKKRMANRTRYHYYQQTQQQQLQQQLANQNTASKQTTSKIQELEKVYQQLTQQQQTDRSNKELEQIKSELEQEMNQLRSQLEEQRVQDQRQAQTPIQEKSEPLRDVNSTEIVQYDDNQLKERNRILEAELLALRRQQNTLLVGQDRSERYINDLKDKENRIDRDLEGNSTEILRLKRQIKELEMNDQKMEELQMQIKILEKNQRNFAILAQTKASKEITDKPVDESAKINAAYLDAFSKDVAELEFKVEKLEAKSFATNSNSIDQAKLKALEDKINALNTSTTTNAPATDYTQQITALQTKLASMEAELKMHKHDSNKPAPIIINTPPPSPAPVPAPAVEELKKFVTSRRQQNVYFANGSTNPNSFEQNKLREIASWLSTYELLDITIKGFASNVGSFEVNQRISQKRAENVKQALLNLGVQSKRIILEPLGIDATSTDPANARRAEVHLLIRE